MKAILVIDMPSTCEECPCCYEAYCPHLRRELGIWALHTGKPIECPLKPMPHKLQADWYTDGYKEGFNACLEEIAYETDTTEIEAN